MIRRARPEELPILLEIRRVVFIQGQNVPEAEERDGKDKDALHFIAFEDELPVGTARILLNDGIGKIGRVAVLSRVSKARDRHAAHAGRIGRIARDQSYRSPAWRTDPRPWLLQRTGLQRLRS